MVRDTARVYLRNNTSPYAVVDSGKVYLTTSGTASITYNNAVNGVNYYFQVKHRNTMETWSKSPGSSFVSSALSYDFYFCLHRRHFGNNMILIDAAPVAFGLYGGDVDQDGIIDASDVSTVDNGAFFIFIRICPE